MAVSLGDELSLEVGRGRLGLGVPLLPSAITCRMVWSGRWGSQLSSHSPVGVNCVLVVNGCGVWVCRLDRLVLDVLREADREKDPWPTGCLPRAFSDMDRVCVGTASSMEVEAIL